MGVPTSEVGYTSAMPRREDHEVHKGHVVALGGKNNNLRRCHNRCLQWLRKITKNLNGDSLCLGRCEIMQRLTQNSETLPLKSSSYLVTKISYRMVCCLPLHTKASDVAAQKEINRHCLRHLVTASEVTSTMLIPPREENRVQSKFWIYRQSWHTESPDTSVCRSSP